MAIAMHLPAQDRADSSSPSIHSITSDYARAIDNKSTKITNKLDKQTEKYLATLERQEAALKTKLHKIDSLAAKRIFSDATSKYASLNAKIHGKSSSLLNKSEKYLPWLDSASTSLAFLKTNPLGNQLSGQAAQLQRAIGKIKDLENHFKQAASIKEFIKERKEYLAAQLKQYNLGNELKKYNVTAAYYAQQVNDYRDVLSDPSKAERKALALLNRLPAFQQFIQKNSMLADMFAMPGGDDPAALAQSMQGLQTRASVQSLIQNQVAGGGVNAADVFQANLADAQNSLTSLKTKLQQMAQSGSSDIDMPDFRPNPNKTRSFLKRIELGTSIQTVKSNLVFPVTTDVSVSAGYRLNRQNVVGVRAAYKMGWGKDIRHMHITSEGMGIGSFVDIKLKGSFFVSGGFELNFQQAADSLRQLHGYDLKDWSKSGLLGISKIVSLKTKFFTKTKLQLLWDFLSYQQLPRTTPVKFRIGYSF
jgi:hypothetical protein